jgi:ferric-dicitrate binding protein FerR (iron transport regulator)
LAHIWAMRDEDDADQARRQAAQAWIAKLSSTSIGTDELEAFFAWRRDPDNRRIWDALEAGRKAVDRFVVRPETERFKVVDIWTGETAVIAMTAQDDMSEQDALHIARLLNRRARGGDRSILQ